MLKKFDRLSDALAALEAELPFFYQDHAREYINSVHHNAWDIAQESIESYASDEDKTEAGLVHVSQCIEWVKEFKIAKQAEWLDQGKTEPFPWE